MRSFNLLYVNEYESDVAQDTSETSSLNGISLQVSWLGVHRNVEKVRPTSFTFMHMGSMVSF
jgi:hypothetical protein